MKHCFTLLIASLLFVTGFAQNDPAAKKILDQVTATIKASKGLTANFTYTTKTKKGQNRGTVKGNIAMRGNSYYLKQGSTEIISNGAKVWNYNGQNEVLVSDVDDDNRTLSPQKLLGNFYDKDFTYKLTSSAGTVHTIVLTPLDKRKNFKQVTVYVDKARKLITRADVVDKTDNAIAFSLSNVNTSASLPASRFSWDAKKYPKVEVVEQ